MKNIKKIRFEQLQDIWNMLYENNDHLSVYQSYEYLEITGLGRLDRKPWALLGIKSLCYVLYHEKEPVCIAPFLYKKSINRVDIYLHGAFTSAGHLDFIYAQEWDCKGFSELMEQLETDFQGRNIKIHFDRISEKSKVNDFMNKHFLLGKGLIKKSKCVSIPIVDSYESYFQSLSKSTRQNIRTYYNRIKKDCNDFDIIVSYGKISDELNNEYMSVYAKRLAERYVKGIKIYTIRRLLTFLIEFFVVFVKNINPMTKALKTHSKGFHAHLEINREVASFCSGFICSDRRIIIPRFAINNTYEKYGPGILLINEIIKMLICNKSQLNILEFDLSRGGETYKYRMGGIDHYNFSYEISLNGSSNDKNHEF